MILILRFASNLPQRRKAAKKNAKVKRDFLCAAVLCGFPPLREMLSIPSQLFSITFKVAFHLAQAVAAKLLAHRAGEH